MNVNVLVEQREKVLEAMRAMRAMRPGSISEQFLEVPQKGKSKPVKRGPYYLWQYYENRKPRRKRLTTPADVARARAEVANHNRFVELCKDFEDLTRQLGEAEREGADDVEQLKKGLKSPSSKAKKSRR